MVQRLCADLKLKSITCIETNLPTILSARFPVDNGEFPYPAIFLGRLSIRLPQRAAGRSAFSDWEGPRHHRHSLSCDQSK